MRVIKPHLAIPTIKDFLTDKIRTIVEAGSFDGVDTERFARAFPQATIHAFEPIKELYDKILKKVEKYNNVRLYQEALSDTTERALFWVSEKKGRANPLTQASSLLPPKDRLDLSNIIFPYKTEVSTITLDMWAERERVQAIDLLWLDIQGKELAVMKAATNSMKSVRAVYTEVPFIEAYEGQPSLEEIFAWMKKEGFSPVVQDFESKENRFFGNVLFLRK